MKSLKITYTLMMLMLVLGLRAQEKREADVQEVPVQVVALGAAMPYSVSVIDPIPGANYIYYWDLLEENTGSVILQGANSSAISLIYADTKVQVGKTYRLLAYVKREYMCGSEPSEIKVKVIERPVVSFVSDDADGLCSFSVLNAEQRAEFDVGIEGYYGDWNLIYSVLDGSDNVIEKNKSVHITGKTGKITFVLDDKFVNNSDEKVAYKVVITDVEFVDGNGNHVNTVGDPDLSMPNPDLIRNIIILPAVKIGTISSEKIDN